VELEFLIVEEVAKCLRVDNATVTRWLKTGKLKGMKKGRRWLISKVDFEEYVNSGGAK